jgi:hypothetical protein
METQALQGREPDRPINDRADAAADESPIADHVIRDVVGGRSVGNGLPADLRAALVAKVEERRSKSLAKYGVLLQAWNGRDAIGDALDAAVDLASYLRQGMIEWGAPNGDAEVADALASAYSAARRGRSSGAGRPADGVPGEAASVTQ